ncbi:hypothetical protein [Brucella pseudogrignonensis]|uniref:Putative tail fiber protein gp53-like C-terminal domain-containing protein n=1 Tax=Brucella pseudogrignonensis TaxID=419475 RepID=A0ABU1M509_9HYPH|nr:hypothetical protein [Brucella pseudogrignonensis]MDR6430998.1 hypothetical protein [Brucella pseudogrignonensis]
MAVLSDYTSGTISLAQGSVTVTGTGTLFEVTRFREGDTLQIQNLTAVIASVDSDTSLTLTEPWTGATIVDGPYRARQLGDISRYPTQAATIIDLLGNGVLTNIADIPVEEGKLLRGNAAGQYEAVAEDEIGIQDPNDSLAKLAALTLAARQILQTDENGALKTLALVANKFLRTDANGDLALSDLGAAAIALLNLSGAAAANKLPYLSSTTAASLSDFTAAARTLLNLIGTAGADQMPYLTGASAAGLTPLTAFARSFLDDTTGAAVYATLGATQSLGENGYHRFPNGLIIQWGRNYGTSDRSIPLPMTFPNAAYAKGATAELAFTGSSTLVVTVDSATNLNNIIVRVRNVSNGGTVAASGDCVVSWYAIGR